MTQFFNNSLLEYSNKTVEWKLTDNLELYKKSRSKTIYKKGDFDYKHNNYGFRCDDFDSWTNHPYRVLFAGCSITEGIGLPLEHTWAKLMHEMICKDIKKEIPFWSIALGGTGIDQMVRFLHNEGDLIRPQVIISYLPSTVRRERWIGDSWSPNHYYKNPMPQNERILIEESYINYQTEKNFVFMNMLLNKWNSTFLFAPFDNDFNISYMNLSNIIQISNNNLCFDLTSNKNKARDGWHPGPECNMKFANIMFDNTRTIIKKCFKN